MLDKVEVVVTCANSPALRGWWLSSPSKPNGRPALHRSGPSRRRDGNSRMKRRLRSDGPEGDFRALEDRLEGFLGIRGTWIVRPWIS